jgi:hypothetical protein
MNELTAGLQQRKARLDAAEAAVIAKWDARRCWQADNAKSGAAWLAWKGRLPIQDTRKKVRHARAMRLLPAIAQAWAAGEIDRSHVTALLGACNPRTAATFATEHKALLDAARTKSHRDFMLIREYWRQMVDEDGAEQSAAAEEAAREVYLSESFGGMWFGKMTFDRISGTIINNCLARIERAMFKTDWAEAKARLGRDPKVDELSRTPAQRRADAMVEMAIRAETAPKDGRRPVPSFTVVVGYETFAGRVCELFNRTVISPGTVAKWLDGADIERVVFDGPSRVIDVGAKRRFYRGALRRAIEVRDRDCFDPTCEDPVEEIDHHHPSSKGGETTQANGRGGCKHHNHHRDHDDQSDWGQHDLYPTWDDVADEPDPETDPDPPDDG